MRRDPSPVRPGTVTIERVIRLDETTAFTYRFIRPTRVTESDWELQSKDPSCNWTDANAICPAGFGAEGLRALAKLLEDTILLNQS